MEKDADITQLLAWLRQRLGNGFVVADHWNIDLRATGLSATNDPSQLVYVSGLGPDRYFLELESAPLPGSNVPYRVLDRYDSVSRDELLDIVCHHLRVVRLPYLHETSK